jgi:hypothetical protein
MQNKAVLMHRFIILAMLKFIVDLTHYVAWSGNQQASLTEPLF